MVTNKKEKNPPKNGKSKKQSKMVEINKTLSYHHWLELGRKFAVFELFSLTLTFSPTLLGKQQEKGSILSKHLIYIGVWYFLFFGIQQLVETAISIISSCRRRRRRRRHHCRVIDITNRYIDSSILFTHSLASFAHTFQHIIVIITQTVLCLSDSIVSLP